MANKLLFESNTWAGWVVGSTTACAGCTAPPTRLIDRTYEKLEVSSVSAFPQVLCCPLRAWCCTQPWFKLPRPGGVLRRAILCAIADGFLFIAVTGGRCAPARRGGARLVCQCQFLARHPREHLCGSLPRSGSGSLDRRRSRRKAGRRTTKQRPVLFSAGLGCTTAVERAADRSAELTLGCPGRKRCRRPGWSLVNGRTGCLAWGGVVTYSGVAGDERVGAGCRRCVGHRHLSG